MLTTDNEVFRFASVRPPLGKKKEPAGGFFLTQLPGADRKETESEEDDSKSASEAYPDILNALSPEQLIARAKALIKKDDGIDFEKLKFLISIKDKLKGSKTEAKQKFVEVADQYQQLHALKIKLWNLFYAYTALGIENRKYLMLYDALRILWAMECLNKSNCNDNLFSEALFPKIRVPIPKSLLKVLAKTEQVGEEQTHKKERERLQEMLDSKVKEYDEIHSTIDELLTLQRDVSHKQPTITDRTTGKSFFKKTKLNSEVRVINPGYDAFLFQDEKKQPDVYERLSQTAKKVLLPKKKQFHQTETLKIADDLKTTAYLHIIKTIEQLPYNCNAQLNIEPLMKRAKQENVPEQYYKKKLAQPAIAEENATTANAYSLSDSSDEQINFHGIRVLGVTDLLMVKESLAGYELGEIAHIENILARETQTRSQLVTSERENTFSERVEVDNLEKEDTKSTERFEMQQEAKETIKTKTEAEAGASLSGSYGFVSFEVEGSFRYSSDKTRVTGSASQLAKEVTSQSVRQIQEKTTKERTLRTTTMTEKRNTHAIDNSQGSQHLAGVYRWVNKNHQFHLVNYGRRLMIETIIPEPAAFYRNLATRNTPIGINLKEPEAITITADNLTKNNVAYYVKLYGAAGIKAYPEASITLMGESAFVVDQKKDQVTARQETLLTIPEGYQVSSYDAMFGRIHFKDTSSCHVYMNGQLFPNVSLTGVEREIKFSCRGSFAAFGLSLSVKCIPTQEKIQNWQLETFEAITQAYERKLADYREQLAAAEIQTGIPIASRHPSLNRKIEREELHKGAIRIMTQNFASTRIEGALYANERFDAMRTGEYGYPELNVSEAEKEGKIIQFLEQMIEWPNMTYRFYPYLYARKAIWDEIYPLSDPADAAFTDFLRAGAARLLLPIRPGYEEAFFYYMSTKTIWLGEHPPTIGEERYVSIIDEVREEQVVDPNNLPDYDPESNSTAYPCVMDRWQAKTPTSLLFLQPTPNLNLTAQQLSEIQSGEHLSNFVSSANDEEEDNEDEDNDIPESLSGVLASK